MNENFTKIKNDETVYISPHLEVREFMVESCIMTVSMTVNESTEDYSVEHINDFWS